MGTDVDIEEILKLCDNKKITFIADREDQRTKDDVTKMCCVQKLKCRLRAQKLRWFGLMVKR